MGKLPLPCRPMDLCITAMPETPDGACELTIEARGRIVATAATPPRGSGEFFDGWRILEESLLAEVRRRC